MSKQNEVLDCNRLRARLVQLEYKGDKSFVEQEIRRIYIEETGKEPPSNIKIYYSSDKEFDFIRDGEHYSGFDGTVIHFYDEELGVNQQYTITRGSEPSESDTWKPKDWMYNIMALFTGQNDSQLQDAIQFNERVTELISNDLLSKGSDIELQKYGLGHSLGGNLITMLQILTETFDDVYTINAARPSAYQLAFVDREFLMSLATEFNFDDRNFSDIYHINPQELKAFSEQYWKERIDEGSIQHLVMGEDILFAIGLIVRGFLEIGEIDGGPRNSIEGFDGLEDVLAQIPDESLRDIQLYFAQFANDYNEGGFDGALAALLRDWTGFRMELVTDFADNMENAREGNYWDTFKGSVSYSALFLPRLISMWKDMQVKIPQLIINLTQVAFNMDIVFDAFIEAGLMSPEQKVGLKDILNQIIVILTDIAEIIAKPYTNLTIGRDIITLKLKYDELQNLTAQFFENLGEVFHAIHLSGEAHSMEHVINALANEDADQPYTRYYEAGDMYFIKDVIQPVSVEERIPDHLSANSTASSGNSQQIKVNISSAVRIYRKGMIVQEELEQSLQAMIRYYDQEILDDYENRKQTLLRHIQDMEHNPRAYQHRLLPPLSINDAEIQRIVVNETIMPIPSNVTHNFEDMFAFYTHEIANGRELISRIKKSIEDMFSEEEAISRLFKLS